MITLIGNVTVVVSDLGRSLKFYRDKLGLRLCFYDKKHDWVCFDCGAGRTTLSLTTPWNKKAKKLVGVRTGVSFQVDDIVKTHRQLAKKKVKFSLKPRKERWGGVVANFEDLDGNKFFLLQMPSGFAK
jgi:catechol 2,3-dioxygenase-like lactoylglutathione lyase family enzyme